VTHSALAERQELEARPYRSSLAVGTRGPLLPQDLPRAHEFKYLWVPRVQSASEPNVSLVLDPTDAWGATQLRLLLTSALTRTQGPFSDQIRIYLAPVAARLGRSAHVEDLAIGEVLRALKDHSGLPASEVAHMLGVQRRQLYKIIEGGSTTPEREARLRAINEVVDELHVRFADRATVRSCLLAPIDASLHSFVELAAEGDVRSAREALFTYLASRADRGIPQYIERPSRSERRAGAKEFARSTRDIAPGE
jgi:transcriptional regulator with XRE-family HTH domain